MVVGSAEKSVGGGLTMSLWRVQKLGGYRRQPCRSWVPAKFLGAHPLHLSPSRPSSCSPPPSPHHPPKKNKKMFEQLHTAMRLQTLVHERSPDRSSPTCPLDHPPEACLERFNEKPLEHFHGTLRVALRHPKKQIPKHIPDRSPRAFPKTFFPRGFQITPPSRPQSMFAEPFPEQSSEHS